MSQASLATPHPHKWLSLIVLSLGLAIVIIDGTVLNVSIGYLIRDLNTTLQDIQWVITAYSLILAALTITGGRLGDIFGRKRMFMLGAILFGLGSLIASVSTNVTTLFWGWSVIEGVGAALMMPATAALVMSIFEGKQRAVAFGIWGGVAGAAAALGPILGGYLTTNYSWNWAFRINLLTIVVLLIGSLFIRESFGSKKQKGFDVLGVLLSGLGLTTLVYGIIKATTYGWWIAKAPLVIGNLELQPFGLSMVPFLILAGMLILVLFMAWEVRYESKGFTPLVSLSLLKNRQFSAGAITTLILVLGQAGLIFALPVFLQSVRLLDAYHTGLALLPMSLSLFFAAPLGGALSRRVNPRYIIQVGLLIDVVAVWVLHSSMKSTVTVAELAPGLALFGAGMGLVMAQITNVTLSAVEVKDAGEASGVSATARQLGMSLGSAIIGTVFLSVFTSQITDRVQQSTALPEAMKPAIMEQIDRASTPEDAPTTATTPSSPIATEIVAIKNEAMTTASQSALAGTGLFTLLCFVVSFSLPNKPVESKKASAVAAVH